MLPLGPGLSTHWGAALDRSGECRLTATDIIRHPQWPYNAAHVWVRMTSIASSGKEAWALSTSGFADQTTKTVYRLPRRVALGLSVAPDESWLLFSQSDGSGTDLMMIDGFLKSR